MAGKVLDLKVEIWTSNLLPINAQYVKKHNLRHYLAIGFLNCITINTPMSKDMTKIK